MKSRVDSADISPKFLVDALKALRDDFVRVINKTATYTRHPSSHASATFSPVMQAFTVERNICLVLIVQWKCDMFGLTDESIPLIIIWVGLELYIRHK